MTSKLVYVRTMPVGDNQSSLSLLTEIYNVGRTVGVTAYSVKKL